MLFCLSASHKTAPFDLLERLSTQSTPIAPIVTGSPEVAGAAVLSTCNRFEIYVDAPSAVHAERAAHRAIAEATGVDGAEFADASITVEGTRVAEHLFAVASGLESVVIGETEIAGQVRRALDDARRGGTVTSDLERLFQRATETQKGVKNATAIGRAGRSLVRLALELADSRLADWSQVRTLLVGTGSYAAATVAALRDRGVTDISVYSPSGRGSRFAVKHALTSVGHDDFATTAAHADLIIACSLQQDYVVGEATLREGGFSGRAMVIDLGMPRNVNPDISSVDGITLLDLETIRVHAPLEELQAATTARGMVKDAAAQFAQTARSQSATPAVVELRKHVFELTEAEIARARSRGAGDEVEQALHHLVGVLLHTPTTRAAELAAAGRADEVFDALETLFGIDARPAASTGVCPFPHGAIRPEESVA
ncbi:MAG: glutamyl-tRNA reductase [Microbacterium sp.]